MGSDFSISQRQQEYTPPAFIFATANDARVPVEHSLAFAAALDAVRVPFELHIFQDGVHGLALATTVTSSGNPDLVNSDVAKWLGLCIAWLENLFGGFGVAD